MSQTADALHGDQRAGSGRPLLEGDEGGQSGAQQRSGVDRRYAVGNPHQPAGPGVDHLRVSAVDGGSGLLLVDAVHEVTAAARLALPALAVQEADADAVTGLPGGDAGPDGVNDADDLMPRNEGARGVAAQAFHGQHVGVADAAGLHAQAHLAGCGIKQLALDQLEVVGAGGLEGPVCGHDCS